MGPRPAGRVGTIVAVRPSGARTVLALVRAAHVGPALAVTALTAALAVAGDLSLGRTALVTSAVLAGQLSIGWSNDLVDRDRDRQVGRGDKPLASGELSARTVRVACAGALGATLLVSLACGLGAGALHLGLVASAWAYNLGLKSTAWSWAPYAVSFGGLPVFVTLAQPGSGPPAAWVPVTGAMLGVGAHLVNVLPDLADDEATGVRGLPHRLGSRWTPRVAAAILVSGSGVIVVGAGGGGVAGILALVLVVLLAGVALVGRGRVPFVASVGIALVDVVLLVATR